MFPSKHLHPALSLPKESYKSIPKDILSVLHESFLGGISETFSATSHDGPLDEALDVGITVLATYALLYPPNYPQIGEFSLALEYARDILTERIQACTWWRWRKWPGI